MTYKNEETQTHLPADKHSNTHSFAQTKHLHELCKFGYSVRQQLSIRVLQEQSQILHLGLAQCKCCTRRTGHPSAPSSVPLRLSSLPFHLNISAVSEEVHKGERKKLYLFLNPQ